MSDYIIDLQHELEELEKRLRVIDDTIGKIQAGILDDKIGVGSRVLVKFKSGQEKEGRVWRIHQNGNLMVNRDGYAAEITVVPSRAKHLSVGTYGKLEREQWRIKTRINRIKEALAGSDIPLDEAKKVIQSKLFQTWYTNNKLDSTISLNELLKAHEMYIRGIAREFLKGGLQTRILEILTNHKR